MKKTEVVTGRLENWELWGNTIVGEMFDDANGRFQDGDQIRTSSLLPMSMQVSTPKEGVTVSTLNSTYLLGKRK